MPRPDPPVETRFKPGVSGNPSGRPRTKPITDRFRDYIEKEASKKTKETVADQIVKEWVAMIKAGDSAALKEALNRLEGATVQKIEAEVTEKQEDPDFEQLVAAFRGHVSLRPKGIDGPEQPSGPSSSGVEGQVGDGSAPGADQPEVPGVHEGHRENGISSNGSNGST